MILMQNLTEDTAALAAWLDDFPRIVALTGAGISAASGIPTYRDGQGRWQHSQPITHGAFVEQHRARQRYWARSMLGWPLMRDAVPNQGHRALACLESRNHVQLLITQNVDRLHQRAGSTNAVDLHGRLDRVVCLDCGTRCNRESVQLQLRELNDHLIGQTAEARPDGDTALSSDAVATVRYPACESCGGTLKPDVVFFGGSVPAERVKRCRQAIAAADALLVIGSSVQVYSGFRFCRHARQLEKPIGIINPGQTRADELAALRLSRECGPLLASLVAHLGA